MDSDATGTGLMIKYVGVDGCRAGWFSVGFGNGKEWDIGIYPDINSLYEHYSKAILILIDIPIGLRDGGGKERTCDLEARKILRRWRGSSIFPVPCRAVLDINSYKDACVINRRLTDRGISKQVWNIIPKIREVDEFVRESKDVPIRETHPEICFWALAEHPMRYPKKTIAGYKERLAILRMVFLGIDGIINEAKKRYPRKDLAIDDILDASAIAVMARKGIKKLDSIPKEPEFDSEGLRMEILCAMQ